ncbi:hypothetical protein [Pseudactinotalea terrae]|uniref:hypothetical protein n=1 Tax=Pseudactinotalea terrae TaxID=1743262 RepID=UPI0012E2056A|nr:hypothetical protein [Pseudactinotalea terrae]
MTETAPIVIYGASDDLVEVEGAVRKEFQLAADGTRVRLTAPDGQSLDVLVDYGGGPVGSRLDWTIGVYAVDAYPDWPVRFGERPHYEGDPSVTIDAPVGTTVTDISR